MFMKIIRCIFWGLSLLFVLSVISVKTINANEKKDSSNESPPTIIAESRTVVKDDPNFNVMDNVSAYDFLGNDLTNNIHVEGTVDIHTEGVYPITFTVKDYYGVSSRKSIDITVESNGASLLPPVLNKMTDSDTTITGLGTIGTKVYVILGTLNDTYEVSVKSDKTFLIPIEHTYPAGTSITAYSEDAEGNKSEEIYSVVQAGDITIGINQILSSDTFVSGYTSPGANVEVSVDNMSTFSHIFKGVADANGKYNISMNGLSYPAGTTVVVTAEFKNHRASKTTIVYPKLVHIDTLSSGSSSVSGKGDPNAIIYLSVNGKEYKFSADAAGRFFGIFDTALVSGDRIIAYQESNDILSGNTTVYIN